MEALQPYLQRFSANKIRDLNGNTLLVIAAQNNLKKMVKLFLRERVDINATNLKGNTALYYSLYYNYVQVAQTLQKYGARDDIKNNDGDICYTYKK